MPVDFIHMDGGRFEDMCASLLSSEFGAVPIDANPGDGGVDSFRGSLLEGVDHIWQYKHFPNGIGESQKSQIRNSLKTAIRNHRPKRWTLVVPCNMNESAQKWFEKQQPAFAKNGVELDYMGGTPLRNLLLKHPAIRQEYFPNTDDHLKTLGALLGGKDKLLERPKASVLDFMQSGSEYINDHPDYLFLPTVTPEGTSIEIRPRRSDVSSAIAEVSLRFDDDPVGKKVRQRWVDMHKKGTPFVVDGDHFTINKSVFDSLLPEGFRLSELRMVPHVADRRLPMRLTFTSKSDKIATLPFIDLHLEREGSEEILFTNKEQDCILIVSLTANAKGGSLRFETRNYGGRRPTEVVQCEEALSVIAEGDTRVDMEHLAMGLRVGSSALSDIEGRNALKLDMLPFYRDLATIERALDPSLRIPASYYDRDVRAAAVLGKILTDGETTRRGVVTAQMTVFDADGVRQALAAGENVIIYTDGTDAIPLFDKTYEFDIAMTVAAPLTLVGTEPKDLTKDMTVPTRQAGDVVIKYTNGRIREKDEHTDIGA